MTRSTFRVLFYANGSKDEYDKEHISRAVLCERQQGKERNCPHHGTGYNQRNGGAVQLQAKHRKGALGRKGKPCQRQEP